MKFDTIILEKKGLIQTLIFNRPEELNKLPRRKQRGIRRASVDGLHGAYDNHFLAV
jgi:hypothetical protein